MRAQPDAPELREDVRERKGTILAGHRAQCARDAVLLGDLRPIRIASSNAYPASRKHRTIAIRTYSVPDLDESQGLFTSIERICGSTGSCAAHALTWRSRPCMALGEWIRQWLQIVAEIATEHPNVVTRLLWPCTRCFVDNRTQSHSTPPYKGAWANATKSATTQSSPTPAHPAHNPHPRPAWGDVHSPERSFSRESFATRAPT